MNNLPLLAGFLTILTISSCGRAVTSSTATATKGGDVAKAQTFNCSMSYTDTNIQTKPLYSETFEATPNLAPITKRFGVSPGDGDYTASVVANSSTGKSAEVALVIAKAKGLHSTAIYNQNSNMLFSVLNVTNAQMFAIACHPKA